MAFKFITTRKLAKSSVAAASGGSTNNGWAALKCDLLAVAIGIHLAPSWQSKSGLRVERGILVDEKLQTSIAGDLRRRRYCPGVRPHLRTKIWNSLWGPARRAGAVSWEEHGGMRSVTSGIHRLQCHPPGTSTVTIIGSIGGGRDVDLPGIARGDSETWRQMPDAIASKTDFDVNRVRIMVGDTPCSAHRHGRPDPFQALQRLILIRLISRSIRHQLLQPDQSPATS